MTAQAPVSRARRKETYERVCRIVAYNTGGPQPPMAALYSVKTIASHAGLDAGQVDRAIRAARENGDLLVDPAGERVACCDGESLRAVIDAEVARAEPRPELIGACNRRLRDLEVESER